MAIDVVHADGTNISGGGDSSPTVSVIVPCYNAKKYLKQAVDSILNQTFRDFELILVDDCSTDGTYEYMKSLWDDNPVVRIVQNKRNIGPDPARNYGIRISRGKYLAFMDNDDCYLPNFLENLYALSEEYQADVVSCMGFYHTVSEIVPEDFSGEYIPDLDSNYRQEVILAPKGIKERMDGWLKREYSIALWNKLYRRDFIMYHDLKFSPRSDDRGFVFACLLHAKTYVKTPFIGNIYRSVAASVSRSRDSKDMEKLEKAIIVLDEFANDFADTMREFPFFEEHPEYMGLIISQQMAILERANILHYFQNANAIDRNVYTTTRGAIRKIFGPHAPLAEFLFLQYQVQARRLAEVAGR